MIRFLALVFVIMALSTKASFSASFDCSKATKKIEKTICSDPELSRLDEQMSKAYMVSKIINPDKVQQIALEQKKWLKYREKLMEIDDVGGKIEHYSFNRPGQQQEVALEQQQRLDRLKKLQNDLEKLQNDLDEYKIFKPEEEGDSWYCRNAFGGSYCYLLTSYQHRIANLVPAFVAIPEFKELTEILDSIRGGPSCYGGTGSRGGAGAVERERGVLLASSVTNPEPNPPIKDYDSESASAANYNSFLRTWSKQGIFERNKYFSLQKVVAKTNKALENYYVNKLKVDSKQAKIVAEYYTGRIVENYVGSAPSGVLQETCNLDDLSKYIQTGEMISRCDTDQLTRIAILYGQPESIVQKLLAPKEDSVKGITNFLSPKRVTTFLSLSAGRPEITKLLIGMGARVDENQTWFGKTALMYAIQERDLESVKLLIQAGADVNKTTRSIPSQEDIEKEWNESYKNPQDKEKQELADNDRIFDWCYIGAGKRTPLMYAAWHGTPEIIEFLIKSGANINAQDSKGAVAYDYLSQNNLNQKDLSAAQKLLKVAIPSKDKAN